MSEMPDPADIPQWDVADRMRKALRYARIGMQEMADYLGVSRQSVGNWINGRVEPSVQTVRLWALRCGVPYEWLCHGTADPCQPGTGRILRSSSNYMQCLTLGVVA